MEAENNTPASKVDDSQLSQGSDYEHLSLFRTAVNRKTTDKSVKPYCCTVTLNTTPTIMEIDTGATVSIISTHQINLLKDWLEHLKLDWINIHRVDSEDFATMFPDLFSSGLGKLKEVEARLVIEENATPWYFKPRPVPLSMR